MQSVPINTDVASWILDQGEVYNIIKFVSDLRQVGSFLRVPLFPPPIKTDRHDTTKILLKVALSTIKQTNNQRTNVNLP